MLCPCGLGEASVVVSERSLPLWREILRRQETRHGGEAHGCTRRPETNRRFIGRRHHRDRRTPRDRVLELWIGLVIVLVGLVAFGGFVRGKWY
jgi:hypothetical protein